MNGRIGGVDIMIILREFPCMLTSSVAFSVSRSCFHRSFHLGCAPYIASFVQWKKKQFNQHSIFFLFSSVCRSSTLLIAYVIVLFCYWKYVTLSVTNQYIDHGVFCAAEIMYLKIFRSFSLSHSLTLITLNMCRIRVLYVIHIYDLIYYYLVFMHLE